MRTAPSTRWSPAFPEHKIQIISPDIGGGFGNKVGIYPGYVLAVVGSIVTGKPVKWMEDRSENLMATSFARDYHMTGSIASTKDGKILGLKVDVLADHGAFNGTAQPTKFPAGFFHIFTGSYDLQAAHCTVKGVYTNKAPGGVAYACSFRITEAVYLVERMVDVLAAELKMDPAELRLKNLLRPEQFPYISKTGWEYDSGEYPRALKLAMEIAGYDELRREQAEKRARGELMGIGISFFTEGVGAGPRKHMDILGLGMADGCELRVHPTGKAQLRLSVQTQGQGHETTFAQIVVRGARHPAGGHRGHPRRHRQHPVRAGHLRIPFDPGVRVRPQPLWRNGSGRRRRSSRPPRSRSAPMTWNGSARGRWQVKGDPEQGRTIAEIAMLSHGTLDPARGRRGPPGRVRRLRPAEPDLPVRRLHLRHRRRSRHRCGQGAPVHRGRRLRAADQPDDRRGSGARRAGRRHRDGPDAADRVRRGRQLRRRVVHGLPAADFDGVPELGARRDRDAVAAPPARPQGRRRIGDRRLAARRGQLGDRRASPRSGSGTPTCR